MNVAHLLDKARLMGVTLRLDGSTVKVGGPLTARDAIRPELAAHKTEIIAHLRAAANDDQPIPADCSGALRSANGGLYLPWGPRLSPDDVRLLRIKLIDLIDNLAKMEHWPSETYDSIMSRAMNGPLSDLLPNIEYFHTRLNEQRAAATARELLAARAWKYDSTKR